MTDAPTCALCGEPMPESEAMFKYHGYSGPCPKAPRPKVQMPPRTLEGFEKYVRENQRDDVMEVILNYLSWPEPPTQQGVSQLEVKARAVVQAWERLGSCIDEVGHENCGEYEGALDDAIIALRDVTRTEADTDPIEAEDVGRPVPPHGSGPAQVYRKVREMHASVDEAINDGPPHPTTTAGGGR